MPHHYAHPQGGPGEPVGLNGVKPPYLAYTFKKKKKKEEKKRTASHPQYRNRVGVGGGGTLKDRLVILYRMNAL